MRSFDFSPLFRSTVGFDRMFDMLDQVADSSQGYPPYNIERTSDNNYRITVAVAGFGDKDLNVEVRGAKLENGLLHVDLERQVPEEKKPRRIAINAPELKTIEGSAKAA